MAKIFAGALLLLLGAGSAGYAVQQPVVSQGVRGRVNPAENQTPGNPVPGLPGMPPIARGNQVRLVGSSTSGASVDMSVAIAPDSSFEFREIPPGSYQVSVSPSSIPPVRIDVRQNEIVGLELGPPLPRIAGTVTVDGGGPQPPFELEFAGVSLDGVAARPTRLVNGGPKFAAELPEGYYRVTARGLPAGFSVRSIETDMENLAVSPLRIRAGETARIAVTLYASAPGPWVKLSGRVTGGVGSTAVSTARLTGPAMSDVLTAAVKPDGSFEFPRVLPGRYEVRMLPSPIYFSKTIVVGNTDARDIAITPPSVKDLVGEFVKIEPGEFMMGCSPIDMCDPQELPVHRVGITRPFEIGRYEVTQAQWEAMMGTNPSAFQSPDRPVENINTWQDAQDFIEKLNALGDGYRYRLPTEAEWEYAARAGSSEPHPGGLDAVAWYQRNSDAQTHLVGQLKPNAWGIYDMIGNVGEWVQDWYSATYYAESPALDPQGPATGSYRVLRGGGYAAIPTWVRVSFRRDRPPYTAFGFRLAREEIRK